ncbi:hypothetical protein IIA79_06725 [bacterium]|nr:hypothetical protein [bacterium]
MFSSRIRTTWIALAACILTGCSAEIEDGARAFLLVEPDSVPANLEPMAAWDGHSPGDYSPRSGPHEAASSWDPFAPLVEMPSLDEALDAAPYLTIADRKVTALDHRNQPDQEVLAALMLDSSGSALRLSASSPLSEAALYIRYDASAEHPVEMIAGPAGGIGFALEVEAGLIAVGVAAIGSGKLDPSMPLATIRFAPGASIAAHRPSVITGHPLSAVSDLAAIDNGEGGVTLQWSERHTGDYDLNSEVNIADLTPIGLNFQRAFTEADADWAQIEVVDGDDNGEINISDLTPIGQSFKSVLVGYNLYRIELASPEEVPDPADAGWAKVPNAGNPDGPSAPRDFNNQNFRLAYTFADEPEPGDFGWYVVPVGPEGDPQEEGRASNVATLTVVPPGPPPAGLSFEIQAPASEFANVNDEFYLAVNVAGVEGLFSANVRFEYDSSMVQLLEAVDSYVEHPNLLEPPLFIAADDVAQATAPYTLLGFNATQTKGTLVKDGDGALGYFKFKALAGGINEEAFRFPQSSTFIFLWGEQYGVPAETPVLGSPQVLNIVE